MQLGSGLVGAATGALAGGNTQSASLGLTTAVTATQNNRLLHPDQINTIKTLSEGDPQKAEQLTAVLCYLQNCQIDGVSGNTGDASTQALYDEGKRISNDTALYTTLTQEITQAGLLTGSNSYGLQGNSPFSVGIPAATADAIGQEKDKWGYGLNMANTVITTGLPLNFSIGTGGNYNLLAAGLSADSGIMLDTTGNVCGYSNMCGTGGPGTSGGFGFVGGVPVDYEDDGVGSVFEEVFAKVQEFRGGHRALHDLETQLTFGGDRGNHVDTEPGTSGLLDDRGLSHWCPSSARVVVRTY
jgi:hypothetical protein